MTPLDPELKRLMCWARQAPEPTAYPLPPGFAATAAARYRATRPVTQFAMWQRAVWGSAWAAAALIVLELVFVTAQQMRTESSYDATPAYQLVTTDLVP